VKPYQVGTAAAIVLIAAVAMFDSRKVFGEQLGSSPGDVGPSWYPFWAAALMGTAALFVGYRAFVSMLPAEGVFTGRDSVFSVVKLVLPMFAYAASLQWLGFYLATAAYMGFFSAFIGKYKWYAVLAAAIICPLAIYLLFEVAFRLLLPKSIFYRSGFPL
jgi:putative tricarboxylic transport membrane protein